MGCRKHPNTVENHVFKVEIDPLPGVYKLFYYAVRPLLLWHIFISKLIIIATVVPKIHSSLVFCQQNETFRHAAHSFSV